MMPGVTIRKGTVDDVPQALGLIRELAEYERAPEQVDLTEEQMKQDGFGPQPVFEFLVAEHQQTIVGLSLYYPRFSTWKGKGMYLEDLVVTEQYRGQGIGLQLLMETAREAKKTQCTGLYWQVLDWNTPAIDFYKRLGADFSYEWVNCRLDMKRLDNI